MTREELYDALVGLLNGMSNKDAVAIYNTYCIECGSMDDYIWENDEYEINEYFGDDSPYEVLCRTGYGDYHISHDYFRMDGYGNVRSFNNIHSDVSPFYADELADFIIDNDNSLDNSDVETLLDKYRESNEDFEESLKRTRKPTRRVESIKRIRRNRQRRK